MYMSPKSHQIEFNDFNQSCGIQLDPNNEWVLLADCIDWKRMEVNYAEMFPSPTGRPAKPLRMALGALIIQKRKKLTDRALVKEIAENPYLQYFLGLEQFQHKCPFSATALVDFRKRLSHDILMEMNEIYLETAESTAEHAEDKVRMSNNGENLGTTILDATCSPSNIKYPQDFELLNEAREKLDEIIDYFHKTYKPWPKPRTYRRVARQKYLELAKTRRRSAKKIRTTIRKMLECVRRNLGYIDAYIAAGYELPEKYKGYIETIRALYEQQKYMYSNKTHTVENRIVSISQPYIRPIKRGKTKTPTEFGAKYDVSIDEKGHARLEKISFDPYNESTVFIDTVERYKERTGHYPARVLVDQIYRTKANRAFCKEHGITMSGPKLGRPSKDRKSTKEEYQDNVDRIEVERFFSKDKRCFGAGLIMTKLKETTLSSITLSVFVTNLFSTNTGSINLFYFCDCGNGAMDSHFIVIDEAA